MLRIKTGFSKFMRNLSRYWDQSLEVKFKSLESRTGEFLEILQKDLFSGWP